MIAWRAAVERVFTPSIALEEKIPFDPSAAARTAGLAALVVFGDHHHVKAAKRLHVGRDSPFAVDHHDDFALGRKRRHHAFDPRVELARDAIDLTQQLRAILKRNLERSALEFVQRVTRHRAADLHRRGSVAAAVSDRAGGLGGQPHPIDRDLVGVGVAGAVFGAHSHADAVAQALAGAVDDRIFKAETLGAAILEVEIGIVRLAFECGAQGSFERALGHPEAAQEKLVRLNQFVGH